nr:tetratricopeptide repeat protein [uncultured Fluviicola sp.]
MSPLFLWSQLSVSPTLNKLKKCKSDNCDSVFVKVVDHEIKKDKKNQFEWLAWEIGILDSIGSDKRDSMLQFIPHKLVPDLKYGSSVYLVLGKQKADSSQFNEAIVLFYKGLKLSQKNKLQFTEATIQRQIALSYLKLDEYKKAESHLLGSLKIARELEDPLLQANAYISLGNAVKEQKRYPEAIRYYNKSLALARELKNKRLIAGNYNNLGNVMRRTKKYNDALNYFFKALEMNKASNNQEWISFNYNNIGQTYEDLSNYSEAITYFQKSCELKQEIGDSLNLISSYLGLAGAYAKNGSYKDAFKFMEKYNSLKDTMNLHEQVKVLEELETKYETEKKEAQIKNFQIQGELQREREQRLGEQAEKNRNYVILAFVLLLFLSGGLLILIRSNRLKQLSNRLLNSKNSEIAESHLALSEAMDELQVKNKEVLDSINYANYIQQASLPNLKQWKNPTLDIDLFFLPKDIVSGDFYFLFPKKEALIFGIGDCTGHGVPGAMVSLIGMNGLEKVTKENTGLNTANMVEEVNEFLLKSLHRGSSTINDGMDLSFCIFEPDSKTLHFTGANHNALIIRSKSLNNQTEFPTRYENETTQIGVINGTRRPVGRSLVNLPFENNQFKCISGDRIVLFSDGYSDQIGGEVRKKMKRANMMNLLLASSTETINDQINFMRDAFQKWKMNAEQIDDVCVMIVEIK